METPEIKLKYSCEVCIISAGYNSATIKYFADHSYRFKKIINLQWEQFMTEEKAFVHDTQWFFKEDAHNIFHISWGEWNVNRLVDFCGLPKKHVLCCGHVGLDFYRPELREAIIPKEQLFSKYGLDKFDKVGLFISSFTLINLPEKQLKGISDARNISEQLPLSVKSQKVILDWFTKYLTDNKNHAIIYRPHPAEKSNPALKELCSKYDNFFVFGEESIKHWINSCDLIYTWFSTSLGEVWASQKSCYILRPYEWTPGEDIVFYKNMSLVTDYSGFAHSFNNNSYHFPIANDTMNHFYSFNKSPSYKLVSDSAESVYKNQSTCTQLSQELYLKNREIRIKSSLPYKLYDNIMDFFAIKLKFPLYNFQNRRNSYAKRHKSKSPVGIDDYTKEMISKNFATEEEIRTSIEFFKKII